MTELRKGRARKITHAFGDPSKNPWLNNPENDVKAKEQNAEINRTLLRYRRCELKTLQVLVVGSDPECTTTVFSKCAVFCDSSNKGSQGVVHGEEGKSPSKMNKKKGSICKSMGEYKGRSIEILSFHITATVGGNRQRNIRRLSMFQAMSAAIFVFPALPTGLNSGGMPPGEALVEYMAQALEQFRDLCDSDTVARNTNGIPVFLVFEGCETFRARVAGVKTFFDFFRLSLGGQASTAKDCIRVLGTSAKRIFAETMKTSGGSSLDEERRPKLILRHEGESIGINSLKKVFRETLKQTEVVLENLDMSSTVTNTTGSIAGMTSPFFALPSTTIFMMGVSLLGVLFAGLARWMLKGAEKV